MAGGSLGHLGAKVGGCGSLGHFLLDSFKVLHQAQAQVGDSLALVSPQALYRYGFWDFWPLGLWQVCSTQRSFRLILSLCNGGKFGHEDADGCLLPAVHDCVSRPRCRGRRWAGEGDLYKNLAGVWCMVFHQAVGTSSHCSCVCAMFGGSPRRSCWDNHHSKPGPPERFTLPHFVDCKFVQRWHGTRDLRRRQGHPKHRRLDVQRASRADPIPDGPLLSGNVCPQWHCQRLLPPVSAKVAIWPAESEKMWKKSPPLFPGIVD